MFVMLNQEKTVKKGTYVHKNTIPRCSIFESSTNYTPNLLRIILPCRRSTKGAPKEHQRSTCELVYSIVTALYCQNKCRKIKRSECLVCSKQKDGFLRASVGYAPIMLGYWNGKKIFFLRFFSRPNIENSQVALR